MVHILCVQCDHDIIELYRLIRLKHIIKSTLLYSLLHRAICDILLQFNVLRLANNVIIHWCWLLLLLLVG